LDQVANIVVRYLIVLDPPAFKCTNPMDKVDITHTNIMDKADNAYTHIVDIFAILLACIVDIITLLFARIVDKSIDGSCFIIF